MSLKSVQITLFYLLFINNKAWTMKAEYIMGVQTGLKENSNKKGDVRRHNKHDRNFTVSKIRITHFLNCQGDLKWLKVWQR